MSVFTNFIRSIVMKNPEIKLKLKKGMSKQTPFQYTFQMLSLSALSVGFFMFLAFMILKDDILTLLIVEGILLISSPLIFKFWFSSVDVMIRKEGRAIDGDLLFVSEYFLVSIESGLPLGNSIKNLSRLDRPGAKFFKKIFTEFKTGKDLESALGDAIVYSPSDNMKVLLKRLKDSLNIGVDLKNVLENFIDEASNKKIIEIKGYAKKLNPIIMMYLILGIVLPSLGVTFFILAAALINITPEFLRLILIIVFLIMFALQYVSYSAFKFTKSTL